MGCGRKWGPGPGGSRFLDLSFRVWAQPASGQEPGLGEPPCLSPHTQSPEQSGGLWVCTAKRHPQKGWEKPSLPQFLTLHLPLPLPGLRELREAPGSPGLRAETETARGHLPHRPHPPSKSVSMPPRASERRICQAPLHGGVVPSPGQWGVSRSDRKPFPVMLLKETTFLPASWNADVMMEHPPPPSHFDSTEHCGLKTAEQLDERNGGFENSSDPLALELPLQGPER